MRSNQGGGRQPRLTLPEAGRFVRPGCNAGLLMWIPAGVVFMVLGLALFAAWMGEAERRVRLGVTDAAAR